MSAPNEPEVEVDDSQSPGHHYMSTFEAMHLLLDKLSILEYGKQFCPEYKCKPLHRYVQSKTRLKSLYALPSFFPLATIDQYM